MQVWTTVDSTWLQLRQALVLAAALLLVPLGVLGVLFWPTWSENGRGGRLAIMTALAGGGPT